MIETENDALRCVEQAESPEQAEIPGVLCCVEEAESAEQAEMTSPGETRRHLKCKIAHGLPVDLRWGDVCRACQHWER